MENRKASAILDEKRFEANLVRSLMVRNHDAPPKERFEVFRQQSIDLGDTLQSHPYRAASEDFFAEVRLMRTSNLIVAGRKSGPVIRANTRPETLAVSERKLYLHALSGGDGVIEVRGRRHLVRNNSLYITLPSERYRLFFESPQNVGLVIALPVDLLSIAEKDVNSLAFTEVTSNPALVSMFMSSVDFLLQAGDFDATGIDAYVAGLADLVLRTALGLDPDHTDTRGARRRQVENYVRAHIVDPELGAETIAAALGVSTRLVYQLFEDQPETLAELIQRERIERAKRFLSTARARPTLDQLAERVGFGSTRTLVRAFQRHCGATPATYIRTHMHWT